MSDAIAMVMTGPNQDLQEGCRRRIRFADGTETAATRQPEKLGGHRASTRSRARKSTFRSSGLLMGEVTPAEAGADTDMPRLEAYMAMPADGVKCVLLCLKVLLWLIVLHRGVFAEHVQAS